MYEFMSGQVHGINGLINLSNIVFLAAYSVRDVLKLRILAIVSRRQLENGASTRPTHRRRERL